MKHFPVLAFVTLVLLAPLRTNQQYSLRSTHVISTWDSFFNVRAIHGLIIGAGTNLGEIQVFRDPLETGGILDNTVLASTSCSGCQMIDLIDYPALGLTYVLSVGNGFRISQINKAAILAGQTALPLTASFMEETGFASLVVDYDHSLVYVSSYSGLYRFNFSSPSAIAELNTREYSSFGSFTERPTCCSPFSVFDNRMTFRNTRSNGNTVVMYLNTTSLSMEAIRTSLFPSTESLSIGWKHPTDEYVYGTRTDTSDGSLRMISAVNLRTFAVTVLPNPSPLSLRYPSSIKAFGKDMAGLSVWDADWTEFYLMNVSNPLSPVVYAMNLSSPMYDWTIYKGRLFACALTMGGILEIFSFNHTETASRGTPQWLIDATGDTFHSVRNPLQLQTLSQVVMTHHGQAYSTLSTSRLQVLDTTGAKFAFAPISYIITNLVNAVVTAWTGTIWANRISPQTFTQEAVDRGNVRIARGTTHENGTVILQATNWLGGWVAPVTIVVQASQTTTSTTTTFTTTTSTTTTSTSITRTTTTTTLTTSTSTTESLTSSTTTVKSTSGILSPGETSIAGATGTTISVSPTNNNGTGNSDPFFALLSTSLAQQITLGCVGFLLVGSVTFCGVSVIRKRQKAKQLQVNYSMSATNRQPQSPATPTDLLPTQSPSRFTGIPENGTATTQSRQTGRPAFPPIYAHSLNQSVSSGYAGNLGAYYAQRAQAILNAGGKSAADRTMVPGSETQSTMVSSVNYISFPGFAHFQNGEAYRMLRKIGSGGMATVWLCDIMDMELRQRAGGSYIVAKVSRDNTVTSNGGSASQGPSNHDDRNLQAWRQEVSVGYFMQKHRNIMKTIGYSQSPRAILLKFYDLGSLDDLIYQPNAHIPDFQWSNLARLDLLLDCCRGLEHMHQNMVAHCDMKPDNVLLAKDPYTFKLYGVLSDFGVAQILNKDQAVSAFQTHHINALSMRYAGPEVITRFRSRVDIHQAETILKGDVFAMAITLFEVITLCKSWST